jgi:hypothetical protein
MPVPIVDIRLEEEEEFINFRGDDSDDEARCRGAEDDAREVESGTASRGVPPYITPRIQPSMFAILRSACVSDGSNQPERPPVHVCLAKPRGDPVSVVLDGPGIAR